MKDVKIDGRTHRVFVLKETGERMVYIPIKLMHRVDYERMKDLQKNAMPNQMLELMKKTKLSNGRNALAQYDSIIHVCIFTNEAKTEAVSIPKDGGLPKIAVKKKTVVAEPEPQATDDSDDTGSVGAETQGQSQDTQQAPRRRGRPPKVNPIVEE